MNYPCRICANTSENRTFFCTEKMFGLGGNFPYFQCAHCGCLQIASVPTDLSPYYPQHYYSYHLEPVPQQGLKAVLAGQRDAARLLGKSWWGAWLPRGTSTTPEVASLAQLPMQAGWRVLDVGCGRGQLLSVLYRAGFRHLRGIDPYLPTDMEVVPGLSVRKQSLESLDEQFDLIMFHHVLEHIEDGRKVLLAALERLRPGGKVFVRIPTVTSGAWERYRENWVQLDAPRHFYLHSHASLNLLASQAGLRVERYWCDSGGMQFWGSELYKAGIPLYPRTLEKHFSAQQLRAYEREADAANASQRGDQIAAVLAPVRT